MTREFIELPEFIERWNELGLMEDDLVELEVYLCKNPEAGNIIKGTGGLRKVRWSLQNKGKSGGIRVLYVDFASYEKMYMITVYPKSEKDNISNEDKTQIRKLINILYSEIGRN